MAQILKTYTETCGHLPYDWNTKLAEAKEKGVSWNDYRDMSWRASQWVLCACGNQCSIIPRMVRGGPVDHELNSLGRLFYGAVERKEWDHSIEILDRIEKRSSVVICQELKRIKESGDVGVLKPYLKEVPPKPKNPPDYTKQLKALRKTAVR